MRKLEVFEPAMCCPTGVCGVSVDPVLIQFNADLQALAQQGVEIARHSLSHAPAAFAAHAEVVKEMAAGMDRLPIVTIDGHIVSTGVYPSKAQLLSKLGLPIPTADKPRIKLGDCGCAPGQCH
ncbi:arsenite efflux transporter metallochaperone ArsD [Aquabacterium sp.]|uniref:arsenite efflux transporter metallochaperone ArsD n=1 Tax=Aquabacterium sp. TaxID=1872578 RepID=UPI0037840F8F